MKTIIALVVSASLSSFAAGDAKQCKQDCRDFVAQCEKGCEQQRKKKDAKMAGVCKKNCNDFVKQCEKGCENGQL
jgi:hypothetical protein